jgi:hypothetical protein
MGGRGKFFDFAYAQIIGIVGHGLTPKLCQFLRAAQKSRLATLAAFLENMSCLLRTSHPSLHQRLWKRKIKVKKGS